MIQSLLTCSVFFFRSDDCATSAETSVAFTTGRPPFSFHDEAINDTDLEVESLRAVLAAMRHTCPIVDLNGR